jgi:hypothetical protein
VSRVTEQQVKEILPSDYAAQNVLPAIDIATMMVNEELTGLSYTEERLRQIELYLSAHFTVLSFDKGPVVSETVDLATTKYAPIHSKGLGATHYGQTAIVLDTSGRLANLSTSAEKANKTATFRVV